MSWDKGRLEMFVGGGKPTKRHGGAVCVPWGFFDTSAGGLPRLNHEVMGRGQAGRVIGLRPEGAVVAFLEVPDEIRTPPLPPEWTADGELVAIVGEGRASYEWRGGSHLVLSADFLGHNGLRRYADEVFCGPYTMRVLDESVEWLLVERVGDLPTSASEERRATGYIENRVECDEEGNKEIVGWDWKGGDVLCISHELLADAEPRALRREGNVFIIGPFRAEYVGEDEIGVYARRIEGE